MPNISRTYGLNSVSDLSLWDSSWPPGPIIKLQLTTPSLSFLYTLTYGIFSEPGLGWAETREFKLYDHAY